MKPRELKTIKQKKKTLEVYKYNLEQHKKECAEAFKVAERNIKKMEEDLIGCDKK